MANAHDLTSLALHSPSHIVGTPFATSSTRFEYPFPDSTTASPLTCSPASSPGSCNTCCSSGSISFTFNLPLSLPPSAQFHRPFAPSSLHGSSAPTSHPSPTHPKLRVQGPPPIPPTLIKKRNRWTLHCLRKKDSPRTDDDPTSNDASGWHSDSDTTSSIRPKSHI
ncbi:hypothetical protein F5887DRAFT_1070965 [Amanita rubescens]|nr:hypothetical protein F5887DRAFT_1070965 [Amanita rubescens]